MVEKSLRELERKAVVQHYGTILFKRLKGESVAGIAESLKMEKASILRCLAWAEANWSRVISTNGDAHTKPKAPKVAGVRQWMIETACSACGARLAAGQDRLVTAALELTDENDDFSTDYRRNGQTIERGGGRQESKVGRREFKHYCDDCAAKEPEFLISNPVFVQTATATAVSHAPPEKSEGLETLKSDLAAGDDRSFNETFPDCADSRDAMARSTGLVEIGRRSGFGSDSLRADAQSGEAAQKARVLTFLKDPKSRGMRPEMRDASRMWAEGPMSRGEVARKLGKEQSTVSRWISVAQKMASAPR
jgi:hypothetical protein